MPGWSEAKKRVLEFLSPAHGLVVKDHVGGVFQDRGPGTGERLSWVNGVRPVGADDARRRTVLAATGLHFNCCARPAVPNLLRPPASAPRRCGSAVRQARPLSKSRAVAPQFDAHVSGTGPHPREVAALEQQAGQRAQPVGPGERGFDLPAAGHVAPAGRHAGKHPSQPGVDVAADLPVHELAVIRGALTRSQPQRQAQHGTPCPCLAAMLDMAWQGANLGNGSPPARPATRIGDQSPTRLRRGIEPPGARHDEG